MIAVLSMILRRVGWFLLGHFIFRILSAAGLAFVSYKYGVAPLFSEIRLMIEGHATELALDWMGFFQLDRAITVIASAYTIRLAAKSLHLVSKS